MIHRRFQLRAIAILLSISIGFGLISTIRASAETNLTTEDFEEIVGTYSVDSSIPSFMDYKDQYKDLRPEESYTIYAKDFVKYTTGEHLQIFNENVIVYGS